MSSALATPTPTAMTPDAISVGAMTRTADGWIFWLQRPDGQSITWARMARRSHL